MKNLIFLCLLLIGFQTNAQTDQELAEKMLYEAIDLMDNGEYEASIQLLEKCEEMDPGGFVYLYEIALAHYFQGDYQTAIEIAKKSRKAEGANYQVSQLIGNAYDMMGESEKAIETYDRAIEEYPNVGRLYLEKGVVLQKLEKYNEAVIAHLTGIEVEPDFPSNYYHLGVLYLSSDDIVPGLLYGEIFMHLERGSNRTVDMSERLYEAYKSAISFDGTKREMDFCRTKILINEEDMKIPFCIPFARHFAVAAAMVDEFNLDSLAKMRSIFIRQYYEEDYKGKPNFLFDYLKELEEKEMFDAYNHYLFQIGAPDAFDTWLETHEEEYERFIEWFTDEVNVLYPEEGDYFVYPF